MSNIKAKASKVADYFFNNEVSLTILGFALIAFMTSFSALINGVDSEEFNSFLKTSATSTAIMSVLFVTAVFKKIKKK